MHPAPSPEHWDDDEENAPQLLVPQQPTWAKRLRRFVGKHWHPTRVDPPAVDAELPHLTGIERTAEVLRHSLLSFEYWISPQGWFREWLKFNTKVALAIGVPAFLVIPLISFALKQLNLWTTLVAQTSNNLIYFPLSALLMLGLISALIYFGRSLRRRGDPRDRYGHPYYQ